MFRVITVIVAIELSLCSVASAAEQIATSASCAEAAQKDAAEKAKAAAEYAECELRPWKCKERKIPEMPKGSGTLGVIKENSKK